MLSASTLSGTDDDDHAAAMDKSILGAYAFEIPV